MPDNNLLMKEPASEHPTKALDTEVEEKECHDALPMGLNIVGILPVAYMVSGKAPPQSVGEVVRTLIHIAAIIDIKGVVENDEGYGPDGLAELVANAWRGQDAHRVECNIKDDDIDADAILDSMPEDAPKH